MTSNTQKVAIFLESAGVNQDGLLTQSNANAKSLVEALDRYSKHEITFFSPSVTDPDLQKRVEVQDYLAMRPDLLRGLVTEFDVIHVANGARSAVRIGMFRDDTILGPNFSGLEERAQRFMRAERAAFSHSWSYLLASDPTVASVYAENFPNHRGVIAFPPAVDLERIQATTPQPRDRIVWLSDASSSSQGRDILAEVAKQLGEQTVFIGHEQADDYRSILDHLTYTKLVVSTSAHLTHQLAIHQALALGVPVVVADNKFYEERIVGEIKPPYFDPIGFAVVPRSSIAIGTMVKAILRDEGLKAAAITQGIQNVREHFSQHAVADQYDSLISRIALERIGETNSDDYATLVRQSEPHSLVYNLTRSEGRGYITLPKHSPGEDPVEQSLSTRARNSAEPSDWYALAAHLIGRSVDQPTVNEANLEYARYALFEALQDSEQSRTIAYRAVNHAAVLTQRGRTDLAEVMLDKVRELQPENLDAWAQTARTVTASPTGSEHGRQEWVKYCNFRAECRQ